MSLFYIAASSSTDCLFNTAIFVRRLHLLNKLVENKGITHANKEKSFLIYVPIKTTVFLTNYSEFKSNEN